MYYLKTGMCDDGKVALLTNSKDAQMPEGVKEPITIQEVGAKNFTAYGDYTTEFISNIHNIRKSGVDPVIMVDPQKNMAWYVLTTSVDDTGNTISSMSVNIDENAFPNGVNAIMSEFSI